MIFTILCELENILVIVSFGANEEFKVKWHSLSDFKR